MIHHTFAKPQIVTERQLLLKLLPYIASYPWALDTIGDLWRMGAPTPGSGPTTEERRILLPGQFKKWWEDVQQRTSIDLTASEVLTHGTRVRNR